MSMAGAMLPAMFASIGAAFDFKLLVRKMKPTQNGALCKQPDAIPWSGPVFPIA
jgi:hypothetical protein